MIKATQEKIEEFRFSQTVNSLDIGFTLKPNLNDPFDYDYYYYSDDRKTLAFCDGKSQTNTMHFKNLWDINALNFLSLNESQVKEYGENADLDYIIFDRNVSREKNANVIPYVRSLNWMITEDDFQSMREIVLLDFKKFYKHYERNESIIRREIPREKNPDWNNPRKRKTVCFSSEADFCKRYSIKKG